MQRDPNLRPRRRRPWSAALAALALTGVLLGAAPAAAGDEFSQGFKDELGRIAAQQAFLVSRTVLTEIFRPPPRRVRDQAPRRAHYEPEAYDPYDPAPVYRDEAWEEPSVPHGWRRERWRAQRPCDHAHPHAEVEERSERAYRSGPGWEERSSRTWRRVR